MNLLPIVEIPHLDQLWFQVGGTLCNLACTHCFISCHPRNRSFEFLRLAEVEKVLQEAAALGVNEYYFTGGEPFLNPEMPAILETTLQFGPATVLTNATVLRDDWLDRLRRAEDATRYSLEFRVSIDGATPEANDPIRGAGTFQRIVRGIRQLTQHGFLPIITVTRTEDAQDEAQLYRDCEAFLRREGVDRPRVKILPTLRIGAEVLRQRGYRDEERVTAEMLADFDTSQLICQHARIVTSRGVFVCPILIEAPEARLADNLSGAIRPYPLQHAACFTCYQYGAVCSNASNTRRDI